MADAILENRDKEQRSRDILALLMGTTVPRDRAESDRKDHYGRILMEAGIDPKKDTALQFIYEKLGGRVITAEEAVKIEKRKEEAKKKGRRDRLGLKE